MSIDLDRLTQVLDETVDDAQARWLAEHPDAERWEWPLILMGALGTTMVLVSLAYTIAAWLVS